jgi:L-malate glycosyltransferase
VRIVHVASGREWRGGQHQVWLLARGLTRAGIDTLVVTGRGTLLAERLAAGGVAVDEVGWGPGLDPRVTWRLMSRLDAGTLVHAHDSHAHTLADVAARLRRAPLVVTRRDIPPIRRPGRYRRAAAVLVISKAVSRQVVRAGVDPGRIHLVPDGVDLDIGARYGAVRPSDPPLVVCVGALEPRKGIDLLLDAAALLRPGHADLRWTVLGEGPERRRLEARREQLGLADVVAFPGFVPDPDAILASATIAVQPSRAEAFGSSVLDALALGVPVVAAAVDGLSEALAGGGGVLVPPGDPAALAAAVDRLLGDPPERARIGAAGIEAARAFGVDRLVERTVAVYRSIMTATAP